MSETKNSLNISIENLKNTVTSGKTASFQWRINQINKINKLLDENRSEIINKLFLDLGKSKVEALAEILLVKEEITLVKKNLR